MQSVFNNGLIRLRVNKEKYDPKYIFYNLQSNKYLAHINSIAYSTSTQPNMKIKDFLRMDIEDLDLQEQKRIAHILGTLDDKIELNRKMNQSLEAMAQALFQSWFVDFDPVLDNALAAGNPIPEPLQKKADKRNQAEASKKLINTNPALAKLFPSTFVFNETLNKWIPEGWSNVKFDDLIEFIVDNRGKTPPITTDELNNKYPLIEVNSLRGENRFYDSSVIKKHVDESIFNNWFRKGHPQKGDILLSTVGSIGEICLVGYDEVCIAQNIISLRSEKIGPYIYELLKCKKTELINLDISSVQPSIKVPHLLNWDVQGDHGLEIVFSSYLESMNNSIHQNDQEIKNLVKTRDILLPKLISGKIKV